MKKNFILVAFLIALYSLSSVAQENSTEEESDQPTLTQQSLLGNININISETDSLDLEALDSIIRALDTILNKIERPSDIYGHEMFKSDSLSIFKPGSIVKIPENYVLGVNDEIVVSIFGLAQLEAQLTVDTAGYVKPADMPKIFLKGITWAQAKALLKRRYSNYNRFRGDQFAASIIKPRVVTVNVFGEVNQPGTFTFEATNNAFNALVAAKGPSKNGSVRNIIIHNGSTQRTLDLYQLINNPAAQFNLYLSDNSIMQVPIARKVVTLNGAVKRPMKYELTESEGLKALVEYAGGVLPEAALEVVQIKRYQGGQHMVIEQDFRSLLSQGREFQLQNGDVVEIKSVSDEVQNSVSVEGAVQVPGEFAISDQTRISDLLKKAKLKREARTDLAFLIRVNPDSTLQLVEINIDEVIKNEGTESDLILKPQDKLVVNDLGLYVDKSTISVKGAIRQEIEYPFDNNAKVKLSQAISLAGGLDAEAADMGYIIRSNPSNRNEKEYLEVDLRSALQNATSTENMALQPWDEVLVLKSSEYADISMVGIRGSVRSPKEILYAPTLRLKDMIVLAGGLKQEASKSIQIFRIITTADGKSRTEAITVELDEYYNIVVGPANFKLEPYDEIVVRNIEEFEFQNFVEVRGEVVNEGAYALTSENETLTSVIKRSGGLTDEAFIEGSYVLRQSEIISDTLPMEQFKLITHLKEALTSESSKYNYILKAGDIIVVPKNENVVYINLANTRAYKNTFAKNKDEQTIGVQFEKDKNAKWYIEKYAGGFGHDANKKSVLVEYASGAMEGTKGGLFKKYPIVENGATISVGSKIKDNELIDERSTKGYPKLKKGVIINVHPDGTVTSEDGKNDNRSNQNEGTL